MIENLSIHGVKLIPINRIVDDRGWFSETFKQSWLTEFEIPYNFVFEFFSYNTNIGTLRGLHSQSDKTTTPGKLLQVLSGSIQDVIVDARTYSPTYGNHLSIVINSADPKLIYIPRGCYHGFVTLEPNTLVGYKVDRYRDIQSECGIAWNDPTLNIDWAIKNHLIISNRDQTNPLWEHAAKF
jgi:dTDP-4-dehydrorhamnose 3,5-epimerase